MTDVINNADVVGTVRVGADPPSANNSKSPKYMTYNSSCFSYDSSNCSVTLQPGNYLLIACLGAIGNDVTYTFQFADMNINGTSNGSAIKYKIVTIASPTTYTHTSNVGAYAVGTCVCVRLN